MKFFTHYKFWISYWWQKVQRHNQSVMDCYPCPDVSRNIKVGVHYYLESQFEDPHAEHRPQAWFHACACRCVLDGKFKECPFWTAYCLDKERRKSA